MRGLSTSLNGRGRGRQHEAHARGGERQLKGMLTIYCHGFWLFFSPCSILRVLDLVLDGE